MLNDQDINKLKSVLATKEDIKDIRYAAISTQLSRHELWIKQIAEKVGLKLVAE